MRGRPPHSEARWPRPGRPRRAAGLGVTGFHLKFPAAGPPAGAQGNIKLNSTRFRVNETQAASLVCQADNSAWQ
jgi:hypothetical protein